MSKKFYNEKLITIRPGLQISFKSQNTSYGFRHLAELREESGTGAEYQVFITEAKSTYYNRTWESFTYQTVGHKAIRKHFAKPEADGIIQLFDKVGSGEAEAETASMFGAVAMVAKFGEVLSDSKEEANSWKKRMIQAGLPDVQFPEDWDSISEEEKEDRLNALINFMKGEK